MPDPPRKNSVNVIGKKNKMVLNKIQNKASISSNRNNALISKQLKQNSYVKLWSQPESQQILEDSYEEKSIQRAQSLSKQQSTLESVNKEGVKDEN